MAVFQVCPTSLAVGDRELVPLCVMMSLYESPVRVRACVLCMCVVCVSVCVAAHTPSGAV